MPPTFPIATSDRGFTFLEVLMALLIIGLLGTALTGATFAALRSQQRGEVMAEAALVWTGILTARWLEASADATLPNRWRMETESMTTGVAPSQTVWQVYALQVTPRLTPDDRLAFQTGAKEVPALP